MPELVSIIVPVFNAEKVLPHTIHSILSQRYANFELLLIDDKSTDSTHSVLRLFKDSRISIYRNPERMGPAHARNRGIHLARGKFIFFTDSDCIVDSDWILEGLFAFQDPTVMGVEGKLLYGAPSPSVRHRLPIQMFCFKGESPYLTIPGTQFCTGNIAYRADVLRQVGGFNETRYGNGREDSDLGYRVQEFGKVIHSDKMQVTHSEVFWDWSSLMANAERYEKDVVFYKDHRFFFYRWGPILHPRFFFMLLCPPFLLWKARLERPSDLRVLLQIYSYLVKLRLCIWRTAFSERILAV